MEPMRTFRAGEVVVYAKDKFSQKPGARARDVDPAPRGDFYRYTVDKYWIVAEVHGEELILVTPGGKAHRVARDDRHLRPLSLSERLRLRFLDRERLDALNESMRAHEAETPA